ncbi:MAG: hypothetical protein NC548_41260 [Lachnospiraceae bacterium]|nr:hypothetical protein [Lachnospiraceae bacterium]
MRFSWDEEQQKMQYNANLRLMFSNVEDVTRAVEDFINQLAIARGVRKEDIMARLYDRWSWRFGNSRNLSEESTKQNEAAMAKIAEQSQTGEKRETDKYKRKDDTTISKVLSLYAAGKNYSEIGRCLHIDRRTVKQIVVRHSV